MTVHHTTESALVDDILSSHNVMGVGEIHAQQAPIAFMNRHMERFKSNGVKQIATEMLFSDLQPELNHFFHTGEIKPRLNSRLAYKDFEMAMRHWDPNMGYEMAEQMAKAISDHISGVANPLLESVGEANPMSEFAHDNFIKSAREHPDSFTSFLHRAREHDIRVIGLDGTNLRPQIDTPAGKVHDLIGRLRLFNDHAVETCGTLEGKTIVHAGGAHLKTSRGITGICERLNGKALGVFDSNHAGENIIQNGQLHVAGAAGTNVTHYDHIVHGRPDYTGRPAQAPMTAQEAFVIHDPATSTRICATHYDHVPKVPISSETAKNLNWFEKLSGSSKATVTLGTIAAVGTAAFFAQKALSEKQGSSKLRNA